jgi:hypothetical protein
MPEMTDEEFWQQFKTELDELVAVHLGTYANGFKVAKLLRQKADELEEQISDDMTLPTD